MNQNKQWFYFLSTSFLGVFQDNFVKNCILFIGIGWNLPSWLNESQLTSIASAALILPYILLSPTAANLTLSYTKHKIWYVSKLVEIPIVIAASFAFYYELIFVGIGAILLLGIQSCIFSPSKYALIADIDGEDKITYGSGLLEMVGFMAILLAPIAASFFNASNTLVITIILLSISILGVITIQKFKVTEAPLDNTTQNSYNPITFIKQSYTIAKQYTNINTGVFGVATFWLIGSMLQMTIYIHCKLHLNVSNIYTGIALSSAAIGIAVGCAIAAKLKTTNSFSVIRFGLIGMLVMCGILLIESTFMWFCVEVFFFALFGGLFEVYNLAFVQRISNKTITGSMNAYMNIVTFIFILLGSLVFSLLTYIGNQNSSVVFAGIVGIIVTTIIMYQKNATTIKGA